MMIRLLLSLLFLLLASLQSHASNTVVFSPFLDPKVEVDLQQHVQQTRKSFKELKLQAILQQQQARRGLTEKKAEDHSAPESEDAPTTASAALRKGAKKGAFKNTNGASSKATKNSKKGSKKNTKKGSKVIGGKTYTRQDPSNCICTENFDSEDVHTLCECEGGDEEQGVEGMEARMNSEHEFVMVRNAVGTPSPEEEYGLNSSVGLNGIIYELVYINKSDGTQDKSWGDEPIGFFNGVCTVVSDRSLELLCKYDLHLYTNGPSQYASVIVSTPITASTEDVGIVTGTAFDFSDFQGGSLTTFQDDSEPVLYAYLSLQ